MSHTRSSAVLAAIVVGVFGNFHNCEMLQVFDAPHFLDPTGSTSIQFDEFDNVTTALSSTFPLVDVGATTSDVDENDDDDQQTAQRVPDEQRLYEDLLADYETAVRPLVNTSGTVVVNFRLTFNQVVDLDERKQLLTTNVFIHQDWLDEQLSWNETRYNGVKTLRVHSSLVWRPDTFMMNNGDDESTGYLHGVYVLLKSIGTVSWPIPVRMRTSCKVDITYFPFDDQVCVLLFGSSIYPHNRLEFNGSLDRDDQNYVDNSEWDLLSVTFERRLRRRHRSKSIVVSSSPTAADLKVCNSPSPSTACNKVRSSRPVAANDEDSGSDVYTELRYQLHIRRRSFYYAFNVIVPCVMLSVLTLLTFWLPQTSGEKISLGLSVFLTYSMFMLLIAEEVPTTSESVPLIGVYMITVMVMTAVSVMMAVMVISCYNRGDRASHPPAWVRRVVLDWLSKPLRMTHDVEKSADNLHLADDVEKRYSCPVHKKTTLKNRPPTPRPTRRGLPATVVKEPEAASETDGNYTSTTPLLFPSRPTAKDWSSNSRVGTDRRARLGVRNGNGNTTTSIAAATFQPEESKLSSSDDSDDDFYENNRPSRSHRKPIDPVWITQASLKPPISALSSHTSTPPATASGGLNGNLSKTTADECSGRKTSLTSCNANQKITANLVGLNSAATPAAAVSFTDDAADASAASLGVAGCPLAKALADRKRAVVEWQAMAAVVDRLLFWVFLVATLVAYLIILVVFPAFKPARLAAL